jgi:MFS transporter, PHS family, inorganic phosphate transporter
MGSPRIISKLWTYVPPGIPDTTKPVPSWQSNQVYPASNIYDVLRTNATQNLITVCIGSLTGSILLLLIINYVPRKQFLMYSFIWLAALFFVTGISFFSVFHTHNHAVSIVLVALCHFSFNLGKHDYKVGKWFSRTDPFLGPNTLTFILPAEIFPTRYRCTCHGIAAAAGKLGSVIVQAVLPLLKWTDPNSNNLGWAFIGFGFVMAAGALFAWVWIPSVQHLYGERQGLRLPNKTLEELAEGVVGMRHNGETIGMRSTLIEAFNGLTRRRKRDGRTN